MANFVIRELVTKAAQSVAYQIGRGSKGRKHKIQFFRDTKSIFYKLNIFPSLCKCLKYFGKYEKGLLEIDDFKLESLLDIFLIKKAYKTITTKTN